MKLSKENLKLALHLAESYFAKNLKSYFNRQSFTDTELREVFDDCAKSLHENTLEIEGYERVQWTKFDPNDPKTYPPGGQDVILINRENFSMGYVFRGSVYCDKGFMPTHWRPLPKPPKTEVEKTNNVSKCADFFHAIDFDICAEIQIALRRER